MKCNMLACGHLTFIQRRVNVEATSWILYNVALKPMKRQNVYNVALTSMQRHYLDPVTGWPVLIPSSTFLMLSAKPNIS